MARAPALQAGGRGFESHRLHTPPVTAAPESDDRFGFSGFVTTPVARSEWRMPKHRAVAPILDLACLAAFVAVGGRRHDDLNEGFGWFHQFIGGHNESFGGITMNIDSNVVDGPTG